MARKAAWRIAGIAAIAFGGGGPVTAQTACVADASNISFGALGVGALAGATTTGSIYEGCPGGSPINGNIAFCNAIGAGSNSASQTSRTMTNGAFSIAYDLYTDAAMNKPYAYPGSHIFVVPYSSVSGGYTTTTTYAKILSASTGIAPGVYIDSYSTPAQSWVSYSVSNQKGPPIVCGSNAVNAGVAPVFTVSVTVLASCSVAASPLNFGSATVLGANIDATASLSVACTVTTPYTISLSPGAGAGATTARRLMSGPSGSIAYSLYRDAARTQLWGATPPPASNADTLSGVGNGSTQTLNVYGRVPPQTTPAQGNYSDTVIVTLTY